MEFSLFIQRLQLLANKKIPIFVPAFSDSSAGFGLIKHQYDKDNNNTSGPPLSIDSAKDFLELTKIKIASKDTGIFIIGGGVPKNFTQDVVAFQTMDQNTSRAVQIIHSRIQSPPISCIT